MFFLATEKTPLSFKTVVVCLLLSFTLMSAVPSQALAQSALSLPSPGSMVNLSPSFVPVMLRGIKVYPDNPFKFDFIIDSGNTGLKVDELKSESEKLARYFLATLTTPEEDLWVNLSPYEDDRIIPEPLGQMDMGRDLLAQDYILKQITASLIYPDSETGQDFWEKVYKKAYEEYGTTKIPMNTFNKVWIVPDRAVVYEDFDRAIVTESHLKVMLEQDYLSLENNGQSTKLGTQQKSQEAVEKTAELSSQIVREVVIPLLEKEVNEGKNFANLRQMYHAMVLATWYKQALKTSILNKVYADKNKVSGVNVDDPKATDKIYAQYLVAFEKGVCDLVRVEQDPYSHKPVARKYFSGGFGSAGSPVISSAIVHKPLHALKIAATSIAVGLMFFANIVLASPNQDLSGNVGKSAQKELVGQSSGLEQISSDYANFDLVQSVDIEDSLDGGTDFVKLEEHIANNLPNDLQEYQEKWWKIPNSSTIKQYPTHSYTAGDKVIFVHIIPIPGLKDYLAKDIHKTYRNDLIYKGRQGVVMLIDAGKVNDQAYLDSLAPAVVEYVEADSSSTRSNLILGGSLAALFLSLFSILGYKKIDEKRYRKFADSISSDSKVSVSLKDDSLELYFSGKVVRFNLNTSKFTSNYIGWHKGKGAKDFLSRLARSQKKEISSLDVQGFKRLVDRAFDDSMSSYYREIFIDIINAAMIVNPGLAPELFVIHFGDLFKKENEHLGRIAEHAIQHWSELKSEIQKLPEGVRANLFNLMTGRSYNTWVSQGNLAALETAMDIFFDPASAEKTKSHALSGIQSYFAKDDTIKLEFEQLKKLFDSGREINDTHAGRDLALIFEAALKRDPQIKVSEDQFNYFYAGIIDPANSGSAYYGGDLRTSYVNAIAQMIINDPTYFSKVVQRIASEDSKRLYYVQVINEALSRDGNLSLTDDQLDIFLDIYDDGKTPIAGNVIIKSFSNSPEQFTRLLADKEFARSKKDAIIHAFSQSGLEFLWTPQQFDIVLSLDVNQTTGEALKKALVYNKDLFPHAITSFYQTQKDGIKYWLNSSLTAALTFFIDNASQEDTKFSDEQKKLVLSSFAIPLSSTFPQAVQQLMQFVDVEIGFVANFAKTLLKAKDAVTDLWPEIHSLGKMIQGLEVQDQKVLFQIFQFHLERLDESKEARQLFRDQANQFLSKVKSYPDVFKNRDVRVLNIVFENKNQPFADHILTTLNGVTVKALDAFILSLWKDNISSNVRDYITNYFLTQVDRDNELSFLREVVFWTERGIMNNSSLGQWQVFLEGYYQDFGPLVSSELFDVYYQLYNKVPLNDARLADYHIEEIISSTGREGIDELKAKVTTMADDIFEHQAISDEVLSNTVLNGLATHLLRFSAGQWSHGLARNRELKEFVHEYYSVIESDPSLVELDPRIQKNKTEAITISRLGGFNLSTADKEDFDRRAKEFTDLFNEVFKTLSQGKDPGKIVAGMKQRWEAYLQERIAGLESRDSSSNNFIQAQILFLKDILSSVQKSETLLSMQEAILASGKVYTINGKDLKMEHQKVFLTKDENFSKLFNLSMVLDAAIKYPQWAEKIEEILSAGIGEGNISGIVELKTNLLKDHVLQTTKDKKEMLKFFNISIFEKAQKSREAQDEKLSLNLLPITKGLFLALAGSFGNACYTGMSIKETLGHPTMVGAIPFTGDRGAGQEILGSVIVLKNSVNVDGVEKEVWMLRAVNPIEDVASQYDMKEFLEKLYKVVKKRAPQGVEVVITMVPGTTSNRPEITSKAKEVFKGEKKDLATTETFNAKTGGESYHIKEAYTVSASSAIVIGSKEKEQARINSLIDVTAGQKPLLAIEIDEEYAREYKIPTNKKEVARLMKKMILGGRTATEDIQKSLKAQDMMAHADGVLRVRPSDKSAEILRDLSVLVGEKGSEEKFMQAIEELAKINPFAMFYVNTAKIPSADQAFKDAKERGAQNITRADLSSEITKNLLQHGGFGVVISDLAVEGSPYTTLNFSINRQPLLEVDPLWNLARWRSANEHSDYNQHNYLMNQIEGGTPIFIASEDRFFAANGDFHSEEENFVVKAFKKKVIERPSLDFPIPGKNISQKQVKRVEKYTTSYRARENIVSGTFMMMVVPDSKKYIVDLIGKADSGDYAIAKDLFKSAFGFVNDLHARQLMTSEAFYDKAISNAQQGNDRALDFLVYTDKIYYWASNRREEIPRSILEKVRTFLKAMDVAPYRDRIKERNVAWNLDHLSELGNEEVKKALEAQSSSAVGGITQSPTLRSDSQDSDEVGGIDFNSDNLDLKRTGSSSIQFNLPSEWQGVDLENIPGFVPVIINIVPLPSLQGFVDAEKDPVLISNS